MVPQYSKNRAEQIISPSDHTTIPSDMNVATGEIAGKIHDRVAMVVPTSIARRVGQRRVKYEINAWKRTISSASSEIRTSGLSQWPATFVSGTIESMAASAA